MSSVAGAEIEPLSVTVEAVLPEASNSSVPPAATVGVRVPVSACCRSRTPLAELALIAPVWLASERSTVPHPEMGVAAGSARRR